MDSFNFYKHCGIIAALNCSSCGKHFDKVTRKPVTGLCGHTICTPCLFKVFNPYSKEKLPAQRFQLCPMLGCRREGFQYKDTTSSSVLMAIDKFEEMEEAVHRYVVKNIERWNGYEKDDLLTQLHNKQVCLKQNETTIQQLTTELTDVKRKLQLAEEDKELYEVRISGMREYIESLQTRLSSQEKSGVFQGPQTVHAQAALGEDISVDSILSPGLSEQLDLLEQKTKQQKQIEKKNYSFSSDSSLSSLEMDKILKRVRTSTKDPKQRKARKVSLDVNRARNNDMSAGGRRGRGFTAKSPPAEATTTTSGRRGFTAKSPPAGATTTTSPPAGATTNNSPCVYTSDESSTISASSEGTPENEFI